MRRCARRGCHSPASVNIPPAHIDRERPRQQAKRQRELAKEEAKAGAITPSPAPSALPVVPAGPSADDIKKWKKELAQVEAQMATLNTEGAELEAKLSTNPHPSVIAEAGKRLKAVNAELQTLEEHWLELTTQLEA